GVVCRTGDGLVEAALDVEASGDDMDRLARRVRDCFHLAAAHRTLSQSVWNGVGNFDARNVGRKGTAATTTLPVLRRTLRIRVFCSLGFRTGHSQSHQRQHQLPLETLEGLRTRALTSQVSNSLGELEI